MGAARLKALLSRLLYERGGVETADPVSVEELGLGELSAPYFPTPWRGLKRAFKRIPILADDVFVDFGSGKGRVEWIWGDGSDVSHSIGLYELAKGSDQRAARDDERGA